MSNLVKLLSQFNRKERYFLIDQALGSEGFSLSKCFRKALGTEIGIEIPSCTFAAMDYHLDWIAASLRAYGKPEFVGRPFGNSDQVVQGTQQDIDFLIAFKSEERYHLIFLEAKGYDSWSNEQMRKKAQRLKEIFGQDGRKYHPEVKPYFCLMSPRKPQNLMTDSWPDWMMRKDGDDRYYWLKLNLKYPRLKVTRCDSNGKPSKAGSHFCIEKVNRVSLMT